MPSAGPPWRLLVLSSSPEVARATEEVGRLLGAEVRACNSLAERGPWDVICLDEGTVGSLELIPGLNNLLPRPAVVWLTAEPDGHAATRVRAACADDVLALPLRVAEACARIAALATRRSAGEEPPHRHEVRGEPRPVREAEDV
jgi:DNA-binding response OmpR family regulator